MKPEDGALSSLQVLVIESHDSTELVEQTDCISTQAAEASCSSVVVETPSGPPVRRPGKRISAAMISPVPVRQSVAVRKRASLGATILTNSPYKVALEDKLSKMKTKKVSLKKKSNVTSNEQNIDVASNNKASISDQCGRSGATSTRKTSHQLIEHA